MIPLRAALWAEALKARRARIAWGISLAFLLLPVMGGLFMVILKDPEQARALGLIGAKAQLTAGTAEWQSFGSILLQGAALGGMMIFAFLAAWVFGREFADHTMKEMLATPTPRAAIASAKFVLIAGWILGLVLLAFLAWLAIGAAVRIPGWAPELAQATLGTLLLTSLLNFMLLPWVAFFAGAGRGYLPAIGWALATLVLAQIAGVLGWGEWFPWAVPALAAGMGGQGPGQIPLHSYAVVAIAFIAGLAATLAWWRGADQPR